MMWVDKHRPKELGDLDLHPEVTVTLQHLVDSRDFPHLLFYGPSGAGKKTRAMALLRAHYGDGVANLKLDHKSVQVTESKSVEIATLASPHHIDMNPSDVGATYDRAVVMNTIRDIAASAPLNVSANASPFKVVVLNEVDKLSKGAQQALRRTMEKYVNTCRLILICNSTSRLIPPLRSRCLGIRVPGPRALDIQHVAKAVLAKENVPPAGDAFLLTLAERSVGNLRRALLMLEASKISKANFQGDGSDIPTPDWRNYIAEIAREIVVEQTPKKLHDIRLKLYELIGQAIPSDLILRELVTALLRIVDPRLRGSIVQQAAFYDRNLKQGAKPIMHLEGFVANAMMVQKQIARA